MKNLVIVLSAAVFMLAGCATHIQQADQAFDRGDYPAALAAYQALAAKHDPKAEAQLAFMYANGDGVPKDTAQTQQWYERAAQDGSDLAARVLGDAYQYLKAEPDYAEAFKWYKVGADRYDLYCMLQVSVFYENGLGVARDHDAALRWLNQYVGQTNIVGQKVYYMYSGGDNTGGFMLAVQWVFEEAVWNTPGMADFKTGTVVLSFRMHDGRASDIEVSQSSGDPQADAAAVALIQKTHLPPVLASLYKVGRFSMDFDFGAPKQADAQGIGPG
jgi:TonB family protein